MFKNMRHELEALERELQRHDEPPLCRYLQKIVFIADAGLGFSVNQLCVGLAGYERSVDTDFDFLNSLARQAKAKAKGSFEMSDKQKLWVDNIRKRLDKACKKHDKEQAKALNCES